MGTIALYKYFKFLIRLKLNRRSGERYERSIGEPSNIHWDMLASFINGTMHTFERHPEMIGSLINGTMNTLQSFPEYHKK